MSAHRHDPLAALAEFPLVEALLGRRSRRFGAGMTIPSGPLAYTSRQPPQPLSELERLLLVALGAGVSGWNLGIPHSAAGATGSGCHYAARPVGRTYPSGAATHGSELLVSDDSGSYITRFRDLDPSAIRQHQAADGDGADLAALLAHVRAHLQKIAPSRVQLPAAYPHVGTHNQWVANQPGSTLFVPVADQAETLLNLLCIYTGEGSPVWDGAQERWLGAPDALFAEGLLQRERAVSLAEIETVAVKHTTAELTIAAYNVQLGLQAIGLGGWLYTGIHGGSLLGAYAAQGVPGFGFRCIQTAAEPEPRPLGLDGIFEPLVPPYVPSMAAGMRRFLARKFGKGGNYDPQRPGPYRDNAATKSSVHPPPPAILDYLESLAQDIHETHGSFPATVAPVAVAIYAQAQHIDLDFYDRFYAPGAYLETHAAHHRRWHE